MMFSISKENLKKVLVIIIFAAAFAYVEAAVVVYLRELFYPSGFEVPVFIDFPYLQFGMVQTLQSMPLKIIFTEMGREASTIIMLATVGWLTGKTIKERLAFFFLPFAIWDIFYYVFLKLIIGWPESLATVDILFLIPIPWIAPVWLPIFASFILIVLSFVLLNDKSEKDYTAI